MLIMVQVFVGRACRCRTIVAVRARIRWIVIIVVIIAIVARYYCDCYLVDIDFSRGTPSPQISAQVKSFCTMHARKIGKIKRRPFRVLILQKMQGDRWIERKIDWTSGFAISKALSSNYYNFLDTMPAGLARGVLRWSNWRFLERCNFISDYCHS